MILFNQYYSYYWKFTVLTLQILQRITQIFLCLFQTISNAIMSTFFHYIKLVFTIYAIRVSYLPIHVEDW